MKKKIVSKKTKRLSLHSVLKEGYTEKSAEADLQHSGYVKDKTLSSHNQQVWYNPETRKLLMNVAGTHNLQDVGTDLYLAFGKLEETKRFKEAKKTLQKAKKKYPELSTTVTGHSLGASIGENIVDDTDRFIGYNPGYTIGQKTRKQKKHKGEYRMYRSEGDLVSLLSHKKPGVGTLKSKLSTKIHPLRAHEIQNIESENIFV